MFYLKFDLYGPLIDFVIGENYEQKHSKRFKEYWTMLHSNIHCWKSETIARFKKHVAEMLEGNELVKTNTNVNTLRTFFSETFLWDTLTELLKFGGSTIDLENSSKLVQSYVFNIYVNICIMVKFHLDDPWRELYFKCKEP